MSRDNVNDEQSTKDITWETLIAASESQIDACREKISILRKSLNFFKKQASIGAPFPATGRRKGS